MNLTKIYKWLTYILAIPTAFIASIAFIISLVALANPTIKIIIIAFILVCIVLYYISSYIFLKKVITKNLICKNIIKDLIKINSIASLIFAALNIVQFFIILFNPSIVETTINAIVEQNQGNINATFSKHQITSLFYTVSGIVTIFSILLITHILIGYKLIKEYADSFLTD